MSNSINSGVKIFSILDILFNSPKNIEEICKKLLEKNIKADKKTVSKYLRTIKKAGFEIVKENGQFHVVSCPFKLKTNSSNCEIIFYLIEHFFNCENSEYKILKTKFENIFEPKQNKEIKKLISKNFKISKTLVSNIQAINSLIKKDKKEVNVLYKGKKLKLTLKEIKFAKNGIFLYAKNKTLKNNSYLKLDFIEKIKPDKTKTSKFKIENGISFEIKEGLVKNYILKKGEVASYLKEKTIITNSYDEREETFSRILKYGTNAEIVAPKREKNLFQKKVNELIEHYNSM